MRMKTSSCGAGLAVALRYSKEPGRELQMISEVWLGTKVFDIWTWEPKTSLSKRSCCCLLEQWRPLLCSLLLRERSRTNNSSFSTVDLLLCSVFIFNFRLNWCQLIWLFGNLKATWGHLIKAHYYNSTVLPGFPGCFPNHEKQSGV